MTKSEAALSHDLLLTIFDVVDGALVWKERPREHFARSSDMLSWNKLWAGKKAGGIVRNGYIGVHLRINGKSYRFFAHRLIWFWVKGQWPAGVIDHINRNTSDNRIENLRDVDNYTNMRNQKMSTRNTSGVSGVYWHKTARKWVARCGYAGRIHLGAFDDIESAAIAVNAYRLANGYTELHGSRQ